MPGLVLGVVVTFALSLILSCTFLRMRCRGVGTPFGPRARYWGTFIAVSTAAVSTAVGMLIVAASSHSGAAYAGIIVAPGLLLSKVPPQRDLEMRPRTGAHLVTLPFSRLYDRIGDDMQAWCDYRMAAAKSEPRYLGHTVQYYWNQMSRVRDRRTRDILDTLRKSIVHKMDCVRLIDLDASHGPAARRVPAAPLHAAHPGLHRRRPDLAGPAVGERRRERAEPVPLARLPARVPQDARLPLPSGAAPARCPAAAQGRARRAGHTGPLDRGRPLTGRPEPLTGPAATTPAPRPAPSPAGPAPGSPARPSPASAS